MVRFGPLVLPVPEDAAAIQVSVALINEAILTGRLDLRKANILITALKLAARFIDRKQPLVAGPTISSLEHDSRGEEIAPPRFVCDEDEDDCDRCPHTQLCPHPGHPGDDDGPDDEEEEEEAEDKDEEEEDENEEEDQEEEDEEQEENEDEDDEEDETTEMRKMKATMKFSPPI
jgi:hypothetical protein